MFSLGTNPTKNQKFSLLNSLKKNFNDIKKILNNNSDKNFNENLEKITFKANEKIFENLKNLYLNEDNKKISSNFLFDENKILLENFNFEIFDLKYNGLNSEMELTNKINSLKNLLKEIPEDLFSGIFDGKNKENFFEFFSQFEIYLKFLNFPNEKFTQSQIFLSVNRNEEIKKNKENFVEKNEKNFEELLNSDYLVFNYLRINVLQKGKFIL